MPSKPPVQAAPMLAACSSSAMVQSVSISSARPWRTQQYQPADQPDQPGHQRAGKQAGYRLVPAPVHGQHADGIGAGTEESGVAKRDDAGIAEHEIERQREQDRDQHLGAEREVVREREEHRDARDPRQQFPGTEPVAPRQSGRRAHVRFPLSAHARFPNKPCGRHSSRINVNA